MVVRTLLLGCASLLLGIQGCSTRTISVEDADDSVSRRLAERKKHPDETAEKGSPFRLPTDAAGVLLSKELSPRGHPGPLRTPGRPGRPDVPMPQFPEVRVSLPTAPADIVRLGRTTGKDALRPELVQEEALEESFAEPTVPQKPRFVASRPFRVSSEEAALPPPLPVMAQAVPDRVSLEDPTMEASTAAVLAAPLKPRARPVPYQRMTVPEPYENRRPLTLLVPAERATPQAGTPRPPRQ
jgi:hypothetical protein